MEHSFVIKGQRLILKPLAECDIERLRLLRNKPENRKWFVYNQIIPVEAQIKWFQKYLFEQGDLAFSIVTSHAPDTFIGTVSLYHITAEEAEFGRFLMDSELLQNRGYACEVVETAVMFAFETLRLQKVSLSVFETNAKAIHIYEKAGFSVVAAQHKPGMLHMEVCRELAPKCKGE